MSKSEEIVTVVSEWVLSGLTHPERNYVAVYMWANFLWNAHNNINVIQINNFKKHPFLLLFLWLLYYSVNYCGRLKITITTLLSFINKINLVDSFDWKSNVKIAIKTHLCFSPVQVTHWTGLYSLTYYCNTAQSTVKYKTKNNNNNFVRRLIHT